MISVFTRVLISRVMCQLCKITSADHVMTELVALVSPIEELDRLLKIRRNEPTHLYGYQLYVSS